MQNNVTSGGIKPKKKELCIFEKPEKTDGWWIISLIKINIHTKPGTKEESLTLANKKGEINILSLKQTQENTSYLTILSLS